MPVKVATDAALALSMAHVMIEEDLCNRKFIQEQTDLPLLVRIDNGRFLRAVSYTHLRAHETVLDLVCRLLLEKQKD